MFEGREVVNTIDAMVTYCFSIRALSVVLWYYHHMNRESSSMADKTNDRGGGYVSVNRN